MNSLKNLIQFINDNWTSLIIVLVLIIGIYNKVEKWLKKSEQEKAEIESTLIESTKEVLKNYVMTLVAQAEIDWSEVSGAGAIKRSEVISQIYQDYPILLNVVQKDKLIEYIDELIEEALIIVRNVIK